MTNVKGNLTNDYAGEAAGTFRSKLDLAQQAITGKKGNADDDAGHALAHRFAPDMQVTTDGKTDADGVAANMFAQQKNFNRGAYRRLENDYARILNSGGTVSFDHTFSGHDANGRPDTIKVNSKVVMADGVKDTIKQTFQNESQQTYMRRYNVNGTFRQDYLNWAINN